jgi:TolB protein
VRGAWPDLELWVRNLDGSAARRLAERGSTPEWSRDGRAIAFSGIATEDGRDDAEIFLADPESGALTRLTSSPGDDQMPTWSPDGRRIAFVSQRGGAPGLWIMDADGSRPRQILDSRRE